MMFSEHMEPDMSLITIKPYKYYHISDYDATANHFMKAIIKSQGSWDCSYFNEGDSPVNWDCVYKAIHDGVEVSMEKQFTSI